MTAQPQQTDVQRIADARAPWCVTVYGDVESWLRGNHPNGTAQAQIRSATDSLRTSGAPDGIIRAIQRQLEEVATPPAEALGAVNGRARSIGIFATEAGSEAFLLTTTPTSRVQISDRFLVAPLLEGALALVPAVFVLALSEKEVRLVDVTQHPASALEVPGLPHDLESTVALDLTGDRDTLAHLRISEDPKGRLREFARAIDLAVEPVLRRDGAVLVIAAAEPLASIYRSTTRYGSIASSVIVGNHDGATPDELANLAAPIVARARRAERNAQLERFAELPARDRVVADLDEIAVAAEDHAIDTLFVDTDRRIPAPGSGFGRTITIDRVDEIIRHAVSGDVTIVPVSSDDLPGADPVAAVLRYAQTTRPAAQSR